MRTITPLSSIFTNDNKDLTGRNIKNKQMINDFLIIDDFVNVYNAKFIIFSYVILVWSMWWLGFRKSL